MEIRRGVGIDIRIGIEMATLMGIGMMVLKGIVIWMVNNMTAIEIWMAMDMGIGIWIGIKWVLEWSV